MDTKEHGKMTLREKFRLMDKLSAVDDTFLKTEVTYLLNLIAKNIYQSTHELENGHEGAR